MRKALSILIASVVIAACGTADRRDDEWRAELEGVDEWDEITGEGTVRQQEGSNRFTTSAEIRNDEPGAVRPWHVHFGTCETGGGIVGEDEDYPRLTVGEDGTASANVTISERLELDEPYHINVHRSDDELETIIACGDLVRVTDDDDIIDEDDEVVEADEEDEENDEEVVEADEEDDDDDAVIVEADEEDDDDDDDAVVIEADEY